MKKRVTPLTPPFNFRAPQVKARRIFNVGVDPETALEIERLAEVSGLSVPRLIRHAINNVLDAQVIPKPDGDLETKY